MTIAQACLLVAVLLPLVCAWIAKLGAFGMKDNHDPRGWASRQTGWRSRAYAAQANGFEALPIFIAGLMVAGQHQAAQGRVDLLALGFIAARVLYIVLYLADLAALRSLVWAAAMFCAGALFFA